MNSLSNDFLPHPKITPAHHQRLAFIYVRQSTPKQVIQNQESQQYQYRLQLRAQELVWAPERVRVIDSDLGFSGSESAGRSGFQELVAEVSLGHAGIVFGYSLPTGTKQCRLVSFAGSGSRFWHLNRRQ